MTGRTIPPETLKYGGMNYPHQQHVDLVGDCNACHQFGPHKVPGFKGKAKCLECHDEAFFKAKKEGK